MTDAEQCQLFLSNALDLARSAGAEAADAVIIGEASHAVGWRLGALEDVSRSESQELGLRVFIGQQQALVSSSDLSKSALAALAERAVAMARLAPADPFAGLAPADRLALSISDGLDLFDDSEPTTEELRQMAAEAEDAARSVKGVTNSEGGNAGYGQSLVALATSHGFSGIQRSSHFSLSASVIASRDDVMERDYDWHSARYRSDLDAAAKIGGRAGEKAVRRLGASKPSSGRMPVIFDPRVSGSIVGHLIAAINGQSVARKSTFLLDSLGVQIFAAGIDILEEPHRPRGLRSRAFDGEGIATGSHAWVQNGVLTGWLLDCASARQLGLQSTGNASRGTGSPPSPSATNVHLSAGNLSAQALIAETGDGIYVTELIGMGVNGVTGDYSRGANGFLIKGGELAGPLNEFTIAGNLKEMFRALTPANDLEFRFGINAPTLRIEQMMIAGG
jgi:PmbA protein